METVLTTVTPEMAKKFLSKNYKHNRKLSPSHVQFFVDEILGDNFATTHQGIAIGVNGALLDGQHRLNAIVETGIPQIMNVTRDVPLSAYQYFDGGKKRTVAERHEIDKRVAQPITALAKLTQGYGYITTESIQMAKDMILDDIVELIGFAPRSRKFFASATMKVAAVACMKTYNRTYAKELYKKMVMSDLTDLPPVGSAFVRQALVGKLGNKGSSARDLLCRGIILFNPQHANVTRISVDRDSLSEIRKKVIEMCSK